MPVDSAEKRRNVAATMPPFPSGVTPNGILGVEWRQQSGWGFAGIAVGEGTGASGGLVPVWLHRRRIVTHII